MSRRTVLKSLGAGALATSVGVGTASADDSDFHYHNPVEEPVVPDPTAIRGPDGAYYVFASNQNRDVDTQERLIPIYRSYNLVDWEYVGEAFDSKPSWKEGYLWAPDIAEYNGQYYLYYSHSVWGDSNPGIGVATSDTIEGPYTNHGKLFRSDEIGVTNSIDPVLHVEGGTPYLVWGSFHGIYGVELTSDGQDWVSGTKFHLAGDAYEGPYFLERNGYHYMILSTGTCCQGHSSTYSLEVGRSSSFFGPYTNQNGTDLRNIDDKYGGSNRPQILTGDSRFAGPGHNAVVQDDSGRWWCIYHAYDTTEPGETWDGAWRRSLLVDPVNWSGGWPTVHDGTPSTQQGTMPSFDRPVHTDVATGMYRIDNVNSGKTVDVSGGESATADGDNVQQWDYLGNENQQWHVQANGDGTYRVEALHSGKVLDVEGGPSATGDGANVHQWAYLEGDNQEWFVDGVGNGAYRLMAVHSDKVLEVAGGSPSTSNGDTLQQWSWNGGDWQRWTFTALASGPVANGTYRIEAAHSGKPLEVAGAGTADGDTVQQWSNNGGSWQHWTVTDLGGGLYQIQNVNSGKYLSVEGGSTADGADVWQWAWEDNGDQKWEFVPVGDGRYRIVASHSGKGLDVANRDTSDGANVVQYPYIHERNQEFRLVRL